MPDESIDVSFPTREIRRTRLSAPPSGFGDFDPFALVRGLRLPQMQRPRQPLPEPRLLQKAPAVEDEYDYEPTFGQLNAAGGITPYTPGVSSVSGLSPVVATGFRRVRKGGK